MLTTFFLILLALTSFLWLAVMAGALSQHSSDPAGNALTRAYIAIAAIALWALLLLLMVVCGSITAAILLAPVGAIGAQVSLHLMAQIRSRRWPVVTIAGAPLLMIVYTAWRFFSALDPSASQGVTEKIVFTGTAGLSLLPLAALALTRWAQPDVPQSAKQTATNAASCMQTEQKVRREAFAALTTASSLFEWWTFVEDPKYRDAALAGARTCESRQHDSCRMLAAGRRQLFLALPELDVQATADLNQAVCGFLLDQVRNLRPYDPAAPMETRVVTEWFEAYFPTIRWLHGHGGDCSAALESIEASVRKYPASPEAGPFLAKLRSLQRSDESTSRCDAN